MENPPVQKTSILKRIKAVYTWFVILVLILVVALLVCYKLSPKSSTKETPPIPVAIEKPLVKVGITTEITNMFPEIPPEMTHVAFYSNIYEGLTILRNGKVVAGLATSWGNPDENTWRFKLRNGVSFQNGNKFTAEDVKYSIEQGQANQWGSYGYLPPIEKITVVDPSTVEIKTVDPDPVLLSKLAYAFVISKQQAGKEGVDKLVGTGPYKLKSFEKGIYTLEANDSYWGGKPKVRQVIYKYYEQPENLATALLNKEIDIAGLDRPDNNRKLEQAGFTVKSFTVPSVNFFVFNFSQGKTAYSNAPDNPFKEKKVRQAFLYGINVDELIKNSPYKENSAVANQFVTSDIFGYDPTIKRPAYNMERAKQLLAEAGYPNGFSLTVDLPPGIGIENEVVRQLQKIGIKAQAKTLTEKEDYDRIYAGDFLIVCFSWATETLDSGEIFNTALHSNRGDNIQGYSSPQLDKIADEASTTFDSKKRLGLLQQAQRLAIADLPWLPLFYGKNYAAVRAGFDWTPHNFGLIYAYEITGR